jgi:hypothetical protein
MKYNPETAPDPAAWLAADEIEKQLSVETYHRRKRIRLPNATVHACFHVVVENQLAEGVPEVLDAYNRLRRDGLSRHDALHALGYVLVTNIHSAFKAINTKPNLNERYLEELKSLSADEWLHCMDDEEGN